MPNTPDGVYGQRPWSTNRPWIADGKAAYPPQAYIGPFASNQERLLTQSLEVANMTAAEIQEYVRPPLPQVEMFPPRFGYKNIVELTSRTYERTDFSQQPNTTESTSRNTLGQV